MSFRPTSDIIAALQARLEALPLDAGVPAGEKLFQVVAVYRESDLGRAFQDLHAVKQRLCFIVPISIEHDNQVDRQRLLSVRTLGVDLLFGDRSFEKGATAALIGGARNVGVIEMAERVIDDLFDTPLVLEDVGGTPGEGAPLILTREDLPNDPGRVAWIQSFTFRAGLRRAALP